MYNVAICNNNSLEIQEIYNILNKYSKEKNIKFNIDMFLYGEELLKSNYEKFDFIVLDIFIGDMTGIEVAKNIRKTNYDIKIILIASTQKYWPKGYEVNAFRYILKPINENLFYNTIQNLLKEINKQKIFIVTEDKLSIHKIPIDHIKYLEIFNRKVAIHTTSNIYISNSNLNYWNEKLHPLGFANPHNSFLVNMNKIIHIDKEKLTLIDGEIIYISQRKYKKFKNTFFKFIKKYCIF